jgi:dsDNA-specific endonuclease/ATPase MutS2
MTRGFGLSFVGLLALALACAHQQSASTQNPMEARVAASQQQSQEALKRAHDAQQKAAEQEKKAADARQEVAKAQQALTQAQQKAQTEQQKAQQLQQQANQATQQASREAQQSQRTASQQLSEQGGMVQRGELSVAGPVRDASSRSVTVQTPDQGAMTFRVTDQTRVTIDGRQASAAEIQPGADARVAYQVGGLEPSAMAIQVMTGNPLHGQPGGAASQGTGAGGTPSHKATGTTGGTGSSGSDKGAGTSGTGNSTGNSGTSGESSSPQSTDTQQSPQ